MKYILTLIIILFSHFAYAETVDRIVAVVNEDVITLSELHEALAARGKTTKSEDARSQVLEELIDDLLFGQALKDAKIEVADDDLIRAIGNVLAQNRMTLDELKQELAGKGVTYEQYKKQVERQIRRIKFMNQVIGPQVKISEQDMKDYYDRNKEKLSGATFSKAEDSIYNALYDERVQQTFNNYLLQQRRKAFIDIR